jgi:hypothetical protein
LRLESPERAFETRLGLGRPGDNAILYGDWERLTVSHSGDHIDWSVGRKPVSLGVLKYLPVWNKFSRPLPGVTLIPIVFGADGADLKLKWDSWVLSAQTLIYRFGQDRVHTAQAVSYGEWINVHLMVGSWWEQSVYGLALSNDVLEGTVSFEYLNYGRGFQWGLGFDRALGEKWTVGVETLYQSEGVTSSLNYTSALQSRFRVFQASFYSWATVGTQWTSLFKSSVGALTNWIDLGSAVTLGGVYSLGQNLDVGVDALLPSVRSGAEFSRKSLEFSDGTTVGLSTQWVVHLTWNW